MVRYFTFAYQRFQALPVLVFFVSMQSSGIPIKLLSFSTLPCAFVHYGLWARKCHIINHSLCQELGWRRFTSSQRIIIALAWPRNVPVGKSRLERFHDGHFVGKIIGSRNSIVGCSQINLRCQHQSLSRDIEYQWAASQLICNKSACAISDWRVRSVKGQFQKDD
jgi:hypothetical protein